LFVRRHFKGVLSVTQIDYIRHLRDVEGASISEIAARVKCDWKTAKKYADGSVDLRQRGRRARKKTAMEGFEEYIEAWLLEDERSCISVNSITEYASIRSVNTL
jgi:hypothetical protein